MDVGWQMDDLAVTGERLNGRLGELEISIRYDREQVGMFSQESWEIEEHRPGRSWKGKG